MEYQELKDLIWKPGRPLVFEPFSADVVKTRLALPLIKLLATNSMSLWDRFRLWVSGFSLLEFQYLGDTFYLISERTETHKGHGSHLIRKYSTNKLTLQAPHSFFDMKTGDIALRVFLESSKFKMVSFNTVHRYTQPDGPQEKLEPASVNLADAAHNPNHPLSVVWREIFKTLKYSAIQLHGFGKDPGNPDVIVSSGSSRSTPFSLGICVDLQVHLEGFDVLHYGQGIQELGGLSNEQGNDATLYGVDFCHLEMSDILRTALDSSDLLTTLSDSLEVTVL